MRPGGLLKTCVKADGSDFIPNEQQDNYSDKFLYASTVDELEAIISQLDGSSYSVLKIAPGEYQLTEILDLSNHDGCTIMADGGPVVLIATSEVEEVLAHPQVSDDPATEGNEYVDPQAYVAPRDATIGLLVKPNGNTAEYNLTLKDICVIGQTDLDAIVVDCSLAKAAVVVNFFGATGIGSGTGCALKVIKTAQQGGGGQ